MGRVGGMSKKWRVGTEHGKFVTERMTIQVTNPVTGLKEWRHTDVRRFKTGFAEAREPSSLQKKVYLEKAKRLE